MRLSTGLVLAATMLPCSAFAANLIPNGEFLVTMVDASGPHTPPSSYFLRPQDKVGSSPFAAPVQFGGTGATTFGYFDTSGASAVRVDGVLSTLSDWGTVSLAGQGLIIQNNNGWQDDTGGDNLNTVAAIRINDSAYVTATILAANLLANTTYELSFDFGTSAVTGDWNTQLRGAVLADIIDGSGTTSLDLSTTSEPTGIVARDRSLTTSFSFTYTTGAVTEDLEIRLGSRDAGVGGNGDQFGFDNVVFDVVPEPGSLALLGLGGLLVASRRRCTNA